MANPAIFSQAPQALDIWQPKQLADGAWVCQRAAKDSQGRAGIETWGATLRAPDGTQRFSAAHFSLHLNAAAICETLNAEQADG